MTFLPKGVIPKRTVGGESEPTRSSTVRPHSTRKTPSQATQQKKPQPRPLILTTRPSRLPLRNPRPTSHPTGQETREQERTPRQQIDLRARHSVSNDLESPHPYEGTSTAPKTLQRCLHVLPGVPSTHPSPWPTGAPHIPAPHPTRSQPHPNTTLTGQQPSANNSTPPTTAPYCTQHSTSPGTQLPTTRVHGPRTGTATHPKKGEICHTSQQVPPRPARIHPPRKGIKIPSPDKENTYPATNNQTPDTTDKTTTTRGAGRRTLHRNTPRRQNPPLHSPHNTRASRREREGEREPTKNRRVAHAAPLA